MRTAARAAGAARLIGGGRAQTGTAAACDAATSGAPIAGGAGAAPSRARTRARDAPAPRSVAAHAHVAAARARPTTHAAAGPVPARITGRRRASVSAAVHLAFEQQPVEPHRAAEKNVQRVHARGAGHGA